MWFNNKASVPIYTGVFLLILVLVFAFIILSALIPYIKNIKNINAFENNKKILLKIDEILTKIKSGEISKTNATIKIEQGMLLIDENNDSMEFLIDDLLFSQGYYERTGNIVINQQSILSVLLHRTDINLILQGKNKLSNGRFKLTFEDKGETNKIKNVLITID